MRQTPSSAGSGDDGQVIMRVILAAVLRVCHK